MGRNWAATLLAFKHITFLSSHEKVKLRVNTTYRPYTLQGIPSYVAYDKTFYFVYLFSLHQKKERFITDYVYYGTQFLCRCYSRDAWTAQVVFHASICSYFV